MRPCVLCLYPQACDACAGSLRSPGTTLVTSAPSSASASISRTRMWLRKAGRPLSMAATMTSWMTSWMWPSSRVAGRGRTRPRPADLSVDPAGGKQLLSCISSGIPVSIHLTSFFIIRAVLIFLFVHNTSIKYVFVPLLFFIILPILYRARRDLSYTHSPHPVTVPWTGANGLLAKPSHQPGMASPSCSFFPDPLTFLQQGTRVLGSGNQGSPPQPLTFLQQGTHVL